jgi:diguanylate cyclase (GGDEF)-like protein
MISSLIQYLKYPSTIPNKIAWSIICISMVIYLFPYFFFAYFSHICLDATAYSPCGFFPNAIGTYFRGWKEGMMIFWFGRIMVALSQILTVGFPWPSSLLIAWIVPSIIGSCFAIFLGTFIALYRKVVYLNDALYQSQEALQKTNDQLIQLASTDPLTGILNHRVLIETLETTLANRPTPDTPCSLLFVDLDHFKSLNDTLGHAAGDQILQEFACLTQSLIGTQGVLGRWGGEEFAIILPESSQEKAARLAEQVRLKVSAHRFSVGSDVQVTCSIGVATLPTDAETQNQLIEKADQAMYAVKHLGRNQVHLASEMLTLNLLPHHSEEAA